MQERMTIPSTHSPTEKALLLAHVLSEEGRTEWALIVYEILVEIGETCAMTRMADILSAPPEYRDVTKAKELYRRACVAGDFCGCHNLAILCEQLGDSVSAEKYYALASARGAPED